MTKLVRTDKETYCFIDVTIENQYVVETMRIYAEFRTPTNKGDRLYRNVFFKTAVDANKLIKGILTNFLAKSIMDSVIASIYSSSGDFKLEFPFKKVIIQHISLSEQIFLYKYIFRTSTL